MKVQSPITRKGYNKNQLATFEAGIALMFLVMLWGVILL